MKYDCEVIRDLLPLYKDGVSNKKSNEIIEEHLKECKECNEYYNAIIEPDIILPEPETIENQGVIDYGKRIKKKRIIIFIVVASIISILLFSVIIMAQLIITGGPPTKTSDINDYGVFEDFKGYSNLYIFPTKIPESAVIESYYYYYQDTFLDPTCQIYLEYSLSKTDFNVEVARLSKISERFEHKAFKDIENKIVYDTEHFTYPAYVTIFNNNYCYEYALINENENKIVCIFTQFIKPNGIKFDKKFLPKDFGNEKNNKGFNIYYSGNGLGYFERHKRKNLNIQFTYITLKMELIL